MSKHPESITSRFTRGTIWNSLSIISGRGFGIIGTIIVARFLGKEKYGEFGIIHNTVFTFGFISAVTMSVTSTRFIAKYRIADKKRAGRVAALCWMTALVNGTALSIGVATFAPWLSRSLYHAPHLAPFLRLAAFTVLFQAISGAQTGMLVGLEGFRESAIITCFIGLSNFVLMLLLTWLFSLQGAVAALLIVSALSWSFNSLLLRRAFVLHDISPCLKASWQESKLLLTFSAPHMLGSLMNMPLQWACNILLARQPGGIGEMGIYSAVSRWRETVLFVPTTLSNVTTAILAERLGVNDGTSIKKVLWTSVGIITATSTLLVLFLGFATPFILRQYGAEFEASGVTAMHVILLGSLVVGIGVPFSNLVTSAGRLYLNLVGGTISGAVLLGLAHLLIHKGAAGLAYAGLGAAIVMFVTQFVIALSILRLQKKP